MISYPIYNFISRVQNGNSQRLGRVSRAETKATAMVFVMILAFTISWTPYSLFALIEQFATERIISPGAGVIPALVAKSSICYDPLIYVGMNTQFRNSMKRIFGIHTKGQTSRTERDYPNNRMSPVNKLSSANNNTTRIISETNLSSIQKTPKDKKNIFNDDLSEATYNEYHRTFTRDNELCTIPENKHSDVERSGDTVYDEDSSNNSNNRKNEFFGESCKMSNERSPVLTFMDSERLLFSKIPECEDIEADASKTFGNEGFEEHCTDQPNRHNSKIENEQQSLQKQRMLRQSFSLDFPRLLNENKQRKLSIETKMECLIQPKGFFRETITKIFDKDAIQAQDSFKSYLCDYKHESGHDNL
ncbi:unnamed protein product [Arctia plantaginis]|uniref:G-protein coupled receptors family 1 profile domain-containing protein n=1 Tax=Arctia plantaginis TaxID=874455 RepID=A0A8S0Z4Q8_ARCPL|nr:unnamed protein product [Arctia plantaginis]CAB3228379.1 unnamed protein product [Arctia plantaginis]